MKLPQIDKFTLKLASGLASLALTVGVGLPGSVSAASNTGQIALAFAEASQQPGSWSVAAPYSLLTNWDGSTGSRPVAIAYSAINAAAGSTVTGPTLTNASAQFAAGGSLLVAQGPGLTVRGTTPATRVAGVSGGSSASIPTPAGLHAGDLVAVYINSGNTTMVAPSGWTRQRQDGQGWLWTRTITSPSASLGTWTSGGGASGWTYAAVAIGGAGASPVVDGVGGGGTQSNPSVHTGSATITSAAASSGASSSSPTPVSTVPATPTPTRAPAQPTATPTSAPAQPTATPTRPPASSPTPVPPTPTPTSPPTGSSTTQFSSQDPWGEDRCNNTSLASVDVKKDFGAQGNGATDDHAAFVNAIATGKVVRIPAGTYVLSQVDLDPDQVVVLCGAGEGATTLIQAASPSQTEAMFSQYDYSGGGHLGYLEIQNLTLDGNNAHVLRRPQGSSMMNYGIVTVMVRKMLVAKTEIRNGYHGLRILDVADQTNGTAGEAIIRDNWFHGMALEAGYTGGTTHNVYVAKDWPSKSVVWIDRNNLEACGSGTGTSCTLPSQTPGQSTGGLLYSPDGSAQGGPPQQIFRIKDNTFRNLGMNMVGTDEPEGEIYLYQQADNAQIIHNDFVNSYYEGVAVFSSNNVEMAYNTVEGNGVPVATSSNYDHMEYYGIDGFSRQTNFPTYVSSSGWNIHDNVIKNSKSYEIGICACFETDSSGNGTGSNVSITNNTFINNADSFDSSRTKPIDTLNAVNVTMSGNNTSAN